MIKQFFSNTQKNLRKHIVFFTRPIPVPVLSFNDGKFHLYAFVFVVLFIFHPFIVSVGERPCRQPH